MTQTLRQTLLFSGMILSAMTGWSVTSAAQQAAPAAEIMIDSSVLESLTQRQQREMALPSTRNLIVPPEQQLAPVTLRPPQETMPDQSAPVLAQPAPIMTAPVDWKSIESAVLAPAVEIKPAPKQAKAQKTEEIPIPGHKPVPPQSVASMVLPAPEETEQVVALTDIPVQETVAAPLIPQPDIIDTPTPEIAPSQQALSNIESSDRPALAPPAAEPIVVAESSSATAENKNLFQKIFSFPIKTSVKTKGGLDPALETNMAATAPAEAVIEDDPAATLAAAIETAAGEETVTEPLDIASITPIPDTDQQPAESWKQDNPEILIENVPLPPERPDKQVAPQAFVQQARRAMVETYTTTEMRDNTKATDPMAAHAKARRLSVADLEDDPLASQLMDMSVDDVADVLNNISPTAGHHLKRELTTASKPRIVRVEGEWIRKSQIQPAAVPTTPEPEPTPAPVKLASLPVDKAAKQTETKIIAPKKQAKAEEQPAKAPAAPGKLTLPFRPGQVDLDDSVTGALKPEMIESLKAPTSTRIQILAYSSAPDGKEAQARRIALSRALAVRSWLVSQGIDAGRMDVKALGLPPSPDAAADQVEMIVR